MKHVARCGLVALALQFGVIPSAGAEVMTPSAAQFARLARCESSGNPRSVSKSGRYHGLYQFDQRTWNSVARSAGRRDLVGVRPSRATATDQTVLARVLHGQRGWQPWPVCGRRVGRR